MIAVRRPRLDARDFALGPAQARRAGAQLHRGRVGSLLIAMLVGMRER